MKLSLKLKSPLAFFDLETTGVNIIHDRIVEISIIKILPSGEVQEKTMRINPTIPIPLESSLIHGIYDGDVKDAPPFKAVAKELYRFLEGCDLAGFNVVRFDIPLLVEEFLRVNMDFDVQNRKLVDAQKIFHLMEKRTLSAAYEFYCKKILDDAHSAEADTKASIEVLEAQIQKYLNQPVVDPQGNQIGLIQDNVAALHEISVTKMVDLAGRMAFNDDGIEIFNFGKHKNKPVLKVLEIEPAYYDWIMKGDFPLDTKRKLTEIKLRSFNLKR